MDRRRGKGPRRGLYPESSPSSVSRFRFFLRVILARGLKSLSLFLSPPAEPSTLRECDLGHPLQALSGPSLSPWSVPFVLTVSPSAKED